MGRGRKRIQDFIPMGRDFGALGIVGELRSVGRIALRGRNYVGDATVRWVLWLRGEGKMPSIRAGGTPVRWVLWLKGEGKMPSIRAGGAPATRWIEATVGIGYCVVRIADLGAGKECRITNIEYRMEK